MVLWIVLLLALLLLLLCRMRVGARVRADGGAVSVDVTVAAFHLRVFPSAEKSAKKQKQKKIAKERPPKSKETAFQKPGRQDILDAAKTLWPPLKRTLRRIGKGVRIAPLELRVTIGGAEDPAAAAQLYGSLNAGVWTVMPVLEQLVDIPSPSLQFRVDFDVPETVPEGTVGITARIGTLLAAGLGIAVPALRWFLRYRKQNTQQPKKAAQPAA